MDKMRMESVDMTAQNHKVFHKKRIAPPVMGATDDAIFLGNQRNPPRDAQFSSSMKFR